MLFAYTYVPHQMEKMQEFIDFIFFEVWCKAPVSGPYSLGLFNSNPDLHDVMTAFHYDDSKGAEFFSGHVERIYGLFAALSAAQIDQLRQWYSANNDIEKVCANDPATSATRYADFPVELKEVRDLLKSFFKDLYSHLDLAALKAKIGDIDDHYDKAFWSANDTGKCPFCGIGDIKGLHHNKREAYDHYLPKALYPFNSVNFRNLAPACNDCNSVYKRSQDPAHGKVGRRKAFFPYSTAGHLIELRIDLKHADIDRLTPEDIELQFGPVVLNEEIETWKIVYGIEERYRAKLLGKNDGKDWITQALEIGPALGVSVEKYLAFVAEQAERKPVADCNFLKSAYLHGCRKAGLL